MRAMILAAGRGNRMRPLTDHTPKPLVKIGGSPLIVHHLHNLARANIHEIVINLYHLGHKIEEALGDGSQWNVNIQYSYENPLLETGGGIVRALKWLGSDPFIVVSGDIFTDYPFASLPNNPKGLGHLVLTDNPPFHPRGDYALVGDKISATGNPLLNFAGIGVYRPELFQGCTETPFALPTLFTKAMSQQAMTGEYYSGIWYNLGTMEQLNELNQLLLMKNSE